MTVWHRQYETRHVHKPYECTCHGAVYSHRHIRMHTRNKFKIMTMTIQHTHIHSRTHIHTKSCRMFACIRMLRCCVRCTCCNVWQCRWWCDGFLLLDKHAMRDRENVDEPLFCIQTAVVVAQTPNNLCIRIRVSNIWRQTTADHRRRLLSFAYNLTFFWRPKTK